MVQLTGKGAKDGKADKPQEEEGARKEGAQKAEAQIAETLKADAQEAASGQGARGQAKRDSGRTGEEGSEDEEEDGDDTDGQPYKKKDSRKKRKRVRDLIRRRVLMSKDVEEQTPEDRERWWELVMSIRGFENVTNNPLRIFFAISIGSADKNRYRNCVKLLPKFTSTYTLAKGEAIIPDNPILVYDRKNFALSYAGLDKHVMKVDMWQVSCWTFNQYFGWKTVKLSAIADHDPNLDLMMRKKLSKKQMSDKKKAKSVGDVALFRCRVNLEEIFDFELSCDNWTLELNKEHTAFNKLKKQRKRLAFTMPKDCRSLPGQKRFLGGGSITHSLEWNREAGRFFWPNCGKSNFRGTRTHLQQSFFIVSVFSGMPTQVVLDSKALQQLDSASVPHRVLGRCLMNLTSVLDISVFQGKVKKFTKIEGEYIVGELSGNVRCTLRSRGRKEAEVDFIGRRPEQLKTATTVSHLSMHERHLVVRVKKCESLPAADLDTGVSDPFLRVSWDNMVMLSPIIPQSLRPVFNMSFYFPVRIVFPELRMSPRLERKHEAVLRYELESKKAIKIQVFDDDRGTSADYLAGCQLTLHDILAVRGTTKVNLLGPIKQQKDAEATDFKVEKSKRWWEEEEWVRMYDGSKTPLQQSGMFNVKETSLIYFEAYFYPDWAENLVFETVGQTGDAESVWARRQWEFEKTNEEFRANLYAPTFPDSIGAKPCREDVRSKGQQQLRRWPCIGNNQLTTQECALMSFVAPIIIPEEYSNPAKLMHWVSNFHYEFSSRQLRTGLIPQDSWKDAESTLTGRKGTPQDHAILLCSLLLGCKKDAYVCKGTMYTKDNVPGAVEQLVEHTWVMTREAGWVTFWEVCNRQMYHLPLRYKPHVEGNSLKRLTKALREAGKEEVAKLEAAEAALVEVADDEEETAAQHHPVMRWENEVEDARIGLEDMDNLPTIGRMPKPKMKVAGKKKDKDGREKLKEEMAAQRETSHIAPNRDMLNRDTALVTCLPYDSIEVVFNNFNLWANRQNHHPACITYDLYEQIDVPAEEPGAAGGTRRWSKWEPLIDKNDARDKDTTIEPITPNIKVEPELKPDRVDYMERDLRIEMKQNLYLYRQKKGMDTLFDDSDAAMMRQLRLFLEIQELWLQIDPDCTALSRLRTAIKNKEDLPPTERFIADIFEYKTWNKHGSPFFSDSPTYAEYRHEQERTWAHLEDKVKEYTRKDSSFPVHRNKGFVGFPVHFSNPEKEKIRNYLMEVPEYRAVIDTKEEDVYYTIECKIFGYLGGVLSVWLYIGMQEPIRDTDF